MALHRANRYAITARDISANGYIVGNTTPFWRNPVAHLLHYPKLSKRYALNQTAKSHHISDIYSERFKRIFGLSSISHHHQLTIPTQWVQQAKDSIAQLTHNHNNSTTLFINHLSTTEKRNLTWGTLLKIVKKALLECESLYCIINLPPAEYPLFNDIHRNEPDLPKDRIVAFCATEHFYQLPALIHACDMVLTVETAIMHIASTLNVPQLVLMRKNATQWQPLQANKILYGENRVSQIDSIEISKELKKLYLSVHKQDK